MSAAIRTRRLIPPAEPGQDEALPRLWLGARKSYRIAVCFFAQPANLVEALDYLDECRVSASDVVALVPTLEAGEAVSFQSMFRPAVFLRLGTQGSVGWVHMSAPASCTARKMGDLRAWASPWTAQEIADELALGHVAFLIYGLRPFIHGLVINMLAAFPAIRVEVHDIPARHQY